MKNFEWIDIIERLKNKGMNALEDWKFEDFSSYFPIFHIWYEDLSFIFEKKLISESQKNNQSQKIQTHVFHLNFKFKDKVSIQTFDINNEHENWEIINSLYEYFHAKYLIYTNRFLFINNEIIFSKNDLKDTNELIL